MRPFISQRRRPFRGPSLGLVFNKSKPVLASSGEAYVISEAAMSGVSQMQRPKAESLLKTVAAVLGGSARGQVTLDANFYHLGGNSLNSVLTVTKLRDQGFLISKPLTTFIS